MANESHAATKRQGDVIEILNGSTVQYCNIEWEDRSIFKVGLST